MAINNLTVNCQLRGSQNNRWSQYILWVSDTTMCGVCVCVAISLGHTSFCWGPQFSQSNLKHEPTTQGKLLWLFIDTRHCYKYHFATKVLVVLLHRKTFCFFLAHSATLEWAQLLARLITHTMDYTWLWSQPVLPTRVVKRAIQYTCFNSRTGSHNSHHFH